MLYQSVKGPPSQYEEEPDLYSIKIVLIILVEELFMKKVIQHCIAMDAVLFLNNNIAREAQQKFLL